MAARQSRKRPAKHRPEPPDLADELAPAPAAPASGDVWDCVEAGADVRVPEHVADLRVQESRWIGGTLAGTVLSGLQCRDTEFVRCDLSGAVLEGAVLTRVRFIGCRMTGTVLDGADLTDVHVGDGSADLASFRMARARFLLVENTSLHGGDFYGFDAQHCGLLGCDLAEASFETARLVEADLHGSTLDDVRGALSLRGARIGPDQMVPLAATLLAAAGIQVTDQPAG